MLAVGALAGATATTGTARAATSGPCDLYAAGGTPCVAAHSTTRALYASYNGPLYQVRRASDNATRNVGVLSAGGYADGNGGSNQRWSLYGEWLQHVTGSPPATGRAGPGAGASPLRCPAP